MSQERFHGKKWFLQNDAPRETNASRGATALPAGPSAGATKPAMGLAGGGAMAQRASVDVYAVVFQAGGRALLGAWQVFHGGDGLLGA